MEKELKEITHLTNDEYTYLINYITEKENKAREKTIEEVKKMLKMSSGYYYLDKRSFVRTLNKLKKDLKK